MSRFEPAAEGSNVSNPHAAEALSPVVVQQPGFGFPAERAGSSLRAVRADGVVDILSWLAIGAFVGMTIVLWLFHQGTLLNSLFPAAALAVAIGLYLARPVMYIGFTLWIWFLTPFVRRLVDLQTGWHDISTVMLSPFLVSGLAFITVCRYFPMMGRKGLFPFALLFVSILYGTLIGILEKTPAAAIFAMLNWAVPIAVAFDLAMRAERFPRLADCVAQCFIWAALLLGLYALYQYFVLPQWDVYWLLNVNMLSQGQPLPKEVRVFSTLNSSAPFAFVMMGSLLTLAVTGGKLRLPAALSGCAGILLSLVRAAWIGTVLATLILILRSPMRARLRLIATLIVGVTLLTSAVIMSPLGEVASKRLATFSDLNDDMSFQQRRDFYVDFLAMAATSVVGAGLGATGVATKLTDATTMASYMHFDSGVMQVPFVLGWFGAAAYASGVMALIWRILSSKAGNRHPYARSCEAIALSMLCMMIFENSLIGPEGFIFWLFLGLSLAADRYSVRAQS